MHLDDVLTELVERSGDRLLRVAYQLTHDRAAAQDLVQEALLRVYGSVRRRGRTPEDWYAYLRRAVINEYVRTRRLQDTAMVPAGSTSLTICGPKAHTLTSGYQTLVSALNRLPARPSTRSCSPSPGPSAPEYQLLFSYPGGPPVSVFILSGCHPEIDNGNLQSNSASSILPVIQQLLKPK